MAMGGGSTIRAAAKVTGLVNSGLRSGVVPETPISAATRAVSSSMRSIAVNTPSASVNTTTVAVEKQSPERHCLGGIDDSDFIGSDREIISPNSDHHPRLVFGAPPTIEEAKTATSELKDALDKIFVSSPRSDESLQDSIHSPQPSHIEGSENKVCLMTGAPSTPKHAIQAFRLLDQSPGVLGVVASIASDPNVWEAVWRNPALQSYIRPKTAIFTSVRENRNIRESLIQGDICYQESPRAHEETVKSDNVNIDFKNELQNIWKNIKLGVVDIMTKLSDFFNFLFGVEGDKKDGKSSDTSRTIPAVFEELLGNSMMGVVVLVIMIVVLKRV